MAEIDYTLTKELKDAGFPIKPCEVGPDCEQWRYSPGKEAIHAPTLEELIDELPAAIQFLVIRNIDAFHITTPSGLIINGATPTEAVARLWLALNK